MDIPAPVRNRAIDEGHGAWLEVLPTIVAKLIARWNLTAGTPFAEGTAAFVCPVALADDTRAVLKVGPPPDAEHLEREAAVLRLADGVGCARLLDEAPEHGALLLERLGPSLYRFGLSARARHTILADTATRLWRPLPADVVDDLALPSGAAKARWLVDYVTGEWERLGRPCREEAIAHAVECSNRREAAHNEDRAVLVHGDVHQWNTLRNGNSWKLVDPDGLAAEPEYDLGIIMREDPVELVANDADPRDRARFLAARTGLQMEAIWEWGVIERVSTALGALAIDLQPEADQLLRAAEIIAARHR